MGDITRTKLAGIVVAQFLSKDRVMTTRLSAETDSLFQSISHVIPHSDSLLHRSRLVSSRSSPFHSSGNSFIEELRFYLSPFYPFSKPDSRVGSSFPTINRAPTHRSINREWDE